MMEAPTEVDVRCSAVVFRGDAVLLVHRAKDGADDWVLPGGTPRPGESMAACAQRETLEETGLPVDPGRVAFVLETMAPESWRRMVDLVFLATMAERRERRRRADRARDLRHACRRPASGRWASAAPLREPRRWWPRPGSCPQGIPHALAL